MPRPVTPSVDEVDAILDGLTTPDTGEVWEATLHYGPRVLAAAAASRAMGNVAPGGGTLVVPFAADALTTYALSDVIDTAGRFCAFLDVLCTEIADPSDDQLNVSLLTRDVGGMWEVVPTFDVWGSAIGASSAFLGSGNPFEAAGIAFGTQIAIPRRIWCLGLRDESVIVAQAFSAADADQATATTNLGDPNQDLTFVCAGYGDAGNLLSVAFVDPATNDSPVSVSGTDFAYIVSLATGPGGAITSTASDIARVFGGSQDGPRPEALYKIIVASLVGNGTGVLEAMPALPLAGGGGNGGAISFTITATIY